jgi:hypothetical protein
MILKAAYPMAIDGQEDGEHLTEPLQSRRDAEQTQNTQHAFFHLLFCSPITQTHLVINHSFTNDVLRFCFGAITSPIKDSGCSCITISRISHQTRQCMEPSRNLFNECTLHALQSCGHFVPFPLRKLRFVLAASPYTAGVISRRICLLVAES